MISINLFSLRKYAYLYCYMDDCKKLNETTLLRILQPLKYGKHYVHAKRVCKDLEIKKLGEYHDLYLKSGTLFLANVFKNWKIVFNNLSF